MPAFTDLLKFDTDADCEISSAEAPQTFLKDFFTAQDTGKDDFLTQAEWDAPFSYLKRGKNPGLKVDKLRAIAYANRLRVGRTRSTGGEGQTRR